MKISDFFIFCSGASPDIIKQCHETERFKYQSIGATVCLTALLAYLSGGYALYFTFSNVSVSVVFGLFWAIIIFNLDRYIVSSIKKTGKKSEEFKTAWPRFLIAFVVAITVSVPLEIQLFNGSITKILGENEDSYNRECEQKFNSQRSAIDNKKSELITQLKAKKQEIYDNDPIIKKGEAEVTAKTDRNEQLRELITSNMEIIKSNSYLVNFTDKYGNPKKKWVRNDLAQNKISENHDLKDEITQNGDDIAVLKDSIKSRQNVLGNQINVLESDYARQIAGVQKQIDELNANRPQIFEKFRQEAAADKDILARLRALETLKEKNSSVKWASWVITLLFILLETAPVVVKLLSNGGPYDELLDRIEHEHYLAQKRIISERNNEVNNMLAELEELNRFNGELRLKTQKTILDEELRTNAEILRDIAEKQAELAKIAIEKWYNTERSRLHTDPGYNYTNPH